MTFFCIDCQLNNATTNMGDSRIGLKIKYWSKKHVSPLLNK